MVRKIEIQFAIPVELTDSEIRMLGDLTQKIAKRHEPPGYFHWSAGCGSKPHFSRADARFLGKEAEPDAPERGEPTFDDEVFCIETAIRQQYSYRCKRCGSVMLEGDRKAHEHREKEDLELIIPEAMSL
jgi:hypothetical protein